MTLIRSFRQYIKLSPQAFQSFVDVDVHRMPGNKTVIVMKDPVESSDSEFGSGMSVTNAVGEFAAAIAARLSLRPQDVTWIEHYPARAGARKGLREQPTWDLVRFGRFTPEKAYEPVWKHLTEEEFAALTERSLVM